MALRLLPIRRTLCQEFRDLDDTQKKGHSVEFLFICFLLLSAIVLCGLCLLVIEYQNGRTRRLNQIWSDRMRTLATRGSAPLQDSDPKAA